ncbi:MAG: hypothetical protein H7222_04335 [Methylotenera sp.]|nr:hypothetical protein [Oligoflexia bacterium]
MKLFRPLAFLSVVAFFGISSLPVVAQAGPGKPKPTGSQRKEIAAHARQSEADAIQSKIDRIETQLRGISQFKKSHPALSLQDPDFLKQACQCYPDFQSSCTPADLEVARWGFPLPKSLNDVSGKKAAGLCSAIRDTAGSAKISPACVSAAVLCENLSDPSGAASLMKDRENLTDQLANLGVTTKKVAHTGETAGEPAAAAHAGDQKVISPVVTPFHDSDDLNSPGEHKGAKAKSIH